MKTFKLAGGTVNVVDDKAEVGEACAADFARLVGEAIKARGRATVALSGGSTPAVLYACLSSDKWRNQIDWSRVHLYLSDERCVSHDSPDSNFGLARRDLLSHVAVPPANIHATQGQDQDPQACASDYEKTIRDEFAEADGIPSFDVIFLGMGPDGHCASLFPESTALAEKDRLVVANYVKKFDTNRITFTYPLLNAARTVIFMVAGADKSSVLSGIVTGQNDRFPAAKVRPVKGQLIWFVDKTAAAGLPISSVCI